MEERITNVQGGSRAWDTMGYTADRELLVKRHTLFVYSIAREYYHPNLGIPFEDLIQEGFAGLLEAACRFRPERGCKFITYAAWWIRKPILRLIAEQSQNIRIPAYRWSRIVEARRRREAERHGSAQPPPGASLDEEGGASRETIDNLLVLSRGEVSLEETFETETTLKEHIADQSIPNPEGLALEGEIQGLLREGLDMLDNRQRMILARHHGLDGDEPQTLQEIGDDLGLTRERVRQIEQETIRKLKCWIRRRQRGFPV
ncbi:MAG: sigma-70 family RNA polymerase sigma factor [Acidobacteriota bacterium]